MAIIKTEHDGWECVPQLNQVSRSLDDIQNEIHEIKHCVRESDLQELVSTLLGAFEEAINSLNTIDTDREFETVEDED